MDEYPLSLKDLRGLDYIPELENLGIACAVVGRGIKRPEQLAKVTEICVKCVRDGRKPLAAEKDELELVFTGRAPICAARLRTTCSPCPERRTGTRSAR